MKVKIYDIINSSIDYSIPLNNHIKYELLDMLSNDTTDNVYNKIVSNFSQISNPKIKVLEDDYITIFDDIVKSRSYSINEIPVTTNPIAIKAEFLFPETIIQLRKSHNIVALFTSSRFSNSHFVTLSKLLGITVCFSIPDKDEIEIEYSNNKSHEYISTIFPVYSFLYQNIGLVRTEMLYYFYNNIHENSEVQYKLYEDLIKSVHGEVRIRLFDFGFDKPNPCNELLLRGIDYLLKYPKILYTQLDVLSELSQKYDRLKVLIPLIKDVRVLKHLKQKYPYIKFGIMVETIECLLDLENFRNETSIINFGTNDLSHCNIEYKSYIQSGDLICGSDKIANCIEVPAYNVIS